MNLSDKNIVVLNEVDSTNNYAKQLIMTEATEEGTVVLARFQKKGKGQAGNSWESEPDKNLLMSLIIYPGFLDAGKQFYISKIISLALYDLLKKTIEYVSIKWPNDIYVGNKKLAGILIENSVKGTNLNSSVIGIGLNLNQQVFTSDAPNPVSLCHFTNEEYHPLAVAKKVKECFAPWYLKLQNQSFYEIDKSYLNLLYRFGEIHLFQKDKDTFKAKIVGIGEFGQLQLKKESGEIEEFMFKEVEFVIE